MVLESFHRGRTVRCPHCTERNDIPERLDFDNVHRDSIKDADRGGWLLPTAIASLVLCCFPACAFLWWYSGGLIQRAKDQEREVEPTLVWSRWVSIAGSVVWGVVYGVGLVGWAVKL
jgi:hypothetical protein